MSKSVRRTLIVWTGLIGLIIAVGRTTTTPAVVVVRAATPCEFTGVSRIVAVGDVHGAADRFVGILQAAGLIDDKQHWSGGRAHLVQLGDVLDRGPDSRRALDLLRRLEGEAAKDGGAVHALLGNHEISRMLGDLRFVTPGEYEAFRMSDSESVREKFIESSKNDDRDQLLKSTPLGQVEMRVAFGRRGQYGEWLRKLNTVVKINDIVFVHGGISPAVAEMSCEQINDRVRKDLTDDLDKTRAAPLASLTAREDGPLWYRGLAQLPDSDTAAFTDLLTKMRAHAIVIAHTVTTDGREHVRFNGRLFQIDTGMQPAYVQGGRASALEIAGDVFTAIYDDHKDTLAGPTSPQ